MKNDAKQKRLRHLFEELRKLKQKELTGQDEFVLAYRRELTERKIRELEEAIEREMDDCVFTVAYKNPDKSDLAEAWNRRVQNENA